MPELIRWRSTSRKGSMFTKRILGFCVNRIVSISLLALLALVSLSFLTDSDGQTAKYFPGSMRYARVLLLIYSVCVNIMGVLFPMRAVMGLLDTIKTVQNYAEPQNGDYGGLEREKIEHVVILPNYKEDLEMLCETLRTLAAHPRASSTYRIILAMEEAEEKAEAKAETLVARFSDSFLDVSYTVHPCGIPGEQRGKGSNLCWAANSVLNSLAKPSLNIDNIIITVMDSDSHLAAAYFSSVTAMHRSATSQEAATTIYVPPIVFNRNNKEVPRFVRVTDMLWSAAGISGLWRYDCIRPPTSVYSLPLSLVKRVGGWDAGSDAIGEDLHMYLKCYWALNGHLTSKIVPSAASQTNVGTNSEENPFRNWALAHKMRYNQAIRHMWGTLDTGYSWRKLLESSFGLDLSDNNTKDTSDEDIANLQHFDTTQIERPNYRKHFFLFLRLFEAHMLPLHCIILGFHSAVYNLSIAILGETKHSLPVELQWEFLICDHLRTLGLALMVCVLIMYRRYEHVVARIDARNAGLQGQDHSTSVSLPQFILDVCLFPLGGFLFGSLPSCHVQLRQLQETELAYTVSTKPRQLEPVLKHNGQAANGGEHDVLAIANGNDVNGAKANGAKANGMHLVNATHHGAMTTKAMNGVAMNVAATNGINSCARQEGRIALKCMIGVKGLVIDESRKCVKCT